MLGQSDEVLAARAQRLRDGIGEPAQLIRTVGRVGGGALPMAELEGPAVALAGGADPETVAARLREATPPVIVRVHDGRVVMDPRTVADEEVDAVVAAVAEALGAR